MNLDQEQISVLVQQLVVEAQRLGLIWTLKPATIKDESTMRGLVDGDTAEISLISLVGRLPVDTRVMVAEVPPAGEYVIGQLSRNEPAIGQSMLRVVADDVPLVNTANPLANIIATFPNLPSDATFRILGWLWWTSTSTTPDFQAQFDGLGAGASSLIAQPTSATGTTGSVDTGVATAITTAHPRGSFNGALSGILAGYYDTAGIPPGDLTLGVAQGTSGGTATILKAGSWVELVRAS